MTQLPPPDASSVARASGRIPPIPPWPPNQAFIRPVLPEREPPATLPLVAAVGAMVVLTVSLDRLEARARRRRLDLEWPLIVYVVLTGLIGYGPSVAWCYPHQPSMGHRTVSRPTSDSHRSWSDLGWGPVIWLAAIGAQMAMAALVVGLGPADLQQHRRRHRTTGRPDVHRVARDHRGDRRTGRGGDGVPRCGAPRTAQPDAGDPGDRRAGGAVRRRPHRSGARTAATSGW